MFLMYWLYTDLKLDSCTKGHSHLLFFAWFYNIIFVMALYAIQTQRSKDF
jgi:hypothetical protein